MNPQWSALFKKFGPIGGISIFLIWWLTQTFSAGQLELRNEVQSIRRDLTSHAIETNHLMFRVCINTADQNPSLLAGCREGMH